MVKSKNNKPKKPYPDFPLFPHGNGQWAKKIRGKLHYFGKWDNPDAAMENYVEQRDDLQAGRTPRKKGDGLSVRGLVNEFLTFKQNRVDIGELSSRTFSDYLNTCERVISYFGKTRPVDSLSADDFEGFRTNLAKTRAAVSLKGEIQHARMLFKFAYDQDLIKNEIKYGQSFRLPSQRVLRLERNKNGSRMFEADDLKKIIDAADIHLKAITLLGINCGFGQSDSSSLPQSAIDLDSGFINHPRPKTGILRRCPLWPETVNTIRESIENKSEPQEEADSNLVFLTKYGRRLVRTGPKCEKVDSVIPKFNKLLTDLKLKRPRVGFYSLRHSFQTVAEDSMDFPAIALIMGHADNSMSGVYRERISDERLQAVTDVVHRWLFGE